MEKEAGLRIGHAVAPMVRSTSLCLIAKPGVWRSRRLELLVWIEVHGKETNRGNEAWGHYESTVRSTLCVFQLAQGPANRAASSPRLQTPV